MGEGRRKWSDHSKGPTGIKLITLQGWWSGHLELRGRERPSQGKGMGRDLSSSGDRAAIFWGQWGRRGWYPNRRYRSGPKAGCYPEFAGPGIRRAARFRLAGGAGRAVRQPFPKARDPEGGACPRPRPEDRFLSPPGAVSPPSHLCRLRPHARLSGKCSPTTSRAGPGKEMNPLPFRILTTSVCTGSSWAADVVSTDCGSSYSPLFPWLSICIAPWR